MAYIRGESRAGIRRPNSSSGCQCATQASQGAHHPPGPAEFWPAGLPFPPSHPYLALVLTRKSWDIMRKAPGFIFSSTPPDDAIRAELKQPWVPTRTIVVKDDDEDGAWEDEDKAKGYGSEYGGSFHPTEWGGGHGGGGRDSWAPANYDKSGQKEEEKEEEETEVVVEDEPCGEFGEDLIDDWDHSVGSSVEQALREMGRPTYTSPSKMDGVRWVDMVSVNFSSGGEQSWQPTGGGGLLSGEDAETWGGPFPFYWIYTRCSEGHNVYQRVIVGPAPDAQGQATQKILNYPEGIYHWNASLRGCDIRQSKQFPIWCD
jgi:hypothetical protein